MILERDQWHLGYASLLRDCRGHSNYEDDSIAYGAGSTMGQVLILTSPTADALSASRIVSYMLRADGVPYKMKVCLGWERLRKILKGCGVVPDETDSNEGEEAEVVPEETAIRAILLINMGANKNLSRLFTGNVKCYVFDSHRPYHLANIHTGKNVVLFNDRPLSIGGEGEIPSDGDDLSGGESEEESDSESEEEDEESNKQDDDESEHEFDAPNSPRIADDESETFEESDNDEDVEQSSKRRKTESGRDAPGDDLGKDRLDVDEPENVLDTTAATADMTMTQSDEESAAEQQQGTTTSSTAQPTMRELHQARRNRIRLHYSSGSYHASPSAWMAYTLCSQLRFGNVSDLLWLACVGVTDAYIHGRLDVSGYSALCVDLKRHVGRLFPNEMVDRVGRAVYAEELEDFSYTNNQADAAGGGGMTQIGLSENGRILSQSEYKFMLLRHTSLWDSLLHSNFVASKLQLWRTEGRQKLMELLAKMGFPLESCRQPWAFVSVGLRRRLRERIDECAEDYGLGNVSYTGFVRVTGYKSLLSASDMVYAVTALLECSAAAMDGSSKDDNDELLSDEDREDREIVQAFNVAFDALNTNAFMDGGVEGSDLSNLVNGGNMTGTTGLGAGIRLAMTLQKTIMSTARNLVERNSIIRLSHFRYAYLNCSTGGAMAASSAVVTPESNKETSSKQHYHVFAKPLVLSRLAQFLMDMHRENGKWTGTKARPLVLLAEKPSSNTFMVVGYEYPEEAGNVVRNKFGQNFELAAKTMRGTFWFDSFDSNVVEVAAKDVQRFVEQLHYMMDSV